MVELITLSAQAGTAAKNVMPWAMKNPRNDGPAASAEEVAQAQAELEDGIVFSS